MSVNAKLIFKDADRTSVTVTYSSSVSVPVTSENIVKLNWEAAYPSSDGSSMFCFQPYYVEKYKTEPTYYWDFGQTNSEGEYIFTNQPSGSKVALTAMLRITWEVDSELKIDTPYVPYPIDDTPVGTGASGTRWQPINEQTTATLDAWTKAAEFSWSINVSPDQLIELTAADWNKLIETVQKNVNWQKQQDANPSIATVNPNDWITAKAYNDIATQAGISQVQADQLITAELINALSNGVNGMERG